MSFAPYTNDRLPRGELPVLGGIRNKHALFEYAERPACERFAPGYPHVLFMSDGTRRCAKVLKTVAHVIVDEDGMGEPVIEVWKLRQHHKYILS